MEKAIADWIITWDQMFNAVRTRGVNDTWKQNPNFKQQCKRVAQQMLFANATPTNRGAVAKDYLFRITRRRDLVNVWDTDTLLQWLRMYRLWIVSIQKSDIVSLNRYCMKGQSIAYNLFMSSPAGGQSASNLT